MEQKRQGGESEILGYKFSGHTTADIYGNFMEVAGKVNSYRLIQISIGGSRVNLKFMILVDSSRDENQLPWLVNIGSCYLDNVHHAFKTVADKSGKALKNYFTFVGFHESPDTREDVNHCWHHIFSISMLCTRCLENKKADQVLCCWENMKKTVVLGKNYIDRSNHIAIALPF